MHGGCKVGEVGDLNGAVVVCWFIQVLCTLEGFRFLPLQRSWRGRLPAAHFPVFGFWFCTRESPPWGARSLSGRREGSRDPALWHVVPYSVPPREIEGTYD